MDRHDEYLGSLVWDYDNRNGEVLLNISIIDPKTPAQAAESLNMICDWIIELEQHYDNIDRKDL